MTTIWWEAKSFTTLSAIGTLRVLNRRTRTRVRQARDNGHANITQAGNATHTNEARTGSSEGQDESSEVEGGSAAAAGTAAAAGDDGGGGGDLAVLSVVSKRLAGRTQTYVMPGDVSADALFDNALSDNTAETW